MATTVLKTSVGPLAVTEADDAIIRVTWSPEEEGEETPLLCEAKRQLMAYFDGDLTVFDLPLAPIGNDFQRSVCDAMLAIPYGETRTYGDIAKDLGTYGQPVGQACGPIRSRSSSPVTACSRRPVWAAIPAQAASKPRSPCSATRTLIPSCCRLKSLLKRSSIIELYQRVRESFRTSDFDGARRSNGASVASVCQMTKAYLRSGGHGA